MGKFSPITLLGTSLGERHRHLNSLVEEAYKSSVPFETIRDLPEASPIDRLFKIDLASKHKDVNYIIKNLKETDMLYVSRALKCTWLIEKTYKDTINADYLEDVLFPEMMITAVNKMKHWLQHNLRDPERCQEFYKKYKESKFDVAVKFLWHCSNEYMLEEFPNIINKIEPQDLKILSEKCPELTKVFYERLEQDRDVISHYLNNEVQFHSNLKFLLKTNPDIFFDGIEKYFNKHRFQPYGKDITRYILVNHKDQFLKKPELYATQLLNMTTLAKYLTIEEVKDVLYKLARAKYLGSWFTYKAVESLIKTLADKERVEIKKILFVDKNYGDKIQQWPYTPPSPPILKRLPQYSLFLDKEQAIINCCVPAFLGAKKCKRVIKRKKILKRVPQKTLLDTLFDDYRFKTFETALFELRKRMRSESIPQNRQFMMLVLVSKTGGSESKLRTLFDLILQYRNEPVHWRAAIVRSLVKRAFAWRLPNDLWSTLLEWAHGLGLDGSPPEAACDEGLHAVVLRNLLADETPNPDVLKSYFFHFTTFTCYSLNTEENDLVRTRLPNLLLTAAKSDSANNKLQHLYQLLDTLSAYKIRYTDFPEVITTVISAVSENPEDSEFLLHRLYRARVARRQLFKENFLLLQNNDSYSNVLRHDTSVFNMDKFKELIENESHLPFDQFWKKLVIYFNESGGLAAQFYEMLKIQAEAMPHKYIARPLTYLAGKDLTSLLKKYETGRWRQPITKEQRLAAELRANAHKSKPKPDLSEFSWETVGPKTIANFVSGIARNKQEEVIDKLAGSRRTLRLALSLTKEDYVRLSIYKTFVELRPGAALKYFLSNIKKEQRSNSFLKIWDTVKPVIVDLDYKNRTRLFHNLIKVENIPQDIKAEYCVLTYQAYLKHNERESPLFLCHLQSMCDTIGESFLYEMAKNYLKNDFVLDKITSRNYESRYNYVNCSVLTCITGRLLLLCTSEEVQKQRLDDLGQLFFSRFEEFWKDTSKRTYLVAILEQFLVSLKYNKVFFDSTYVSCMPVFERVISWMHRLLPIEKWFHLYTEIHLTMLYYKTARYCSSEKPEFFTKDLKDIEKGIDMFGDVFGKFVAKEFEELKVNYFQSIREIYENHLTAYVEKYLDYRQYDESKEKFVIALVKSILLEAEASEAHFVASDLFEYRKRHFVFGYDVDEIQNLLKDTKNDELRMFLELPVV